MQILAVGAMAVGPTTGALALDERAREHVAEGTEAANEPAAGSEIGFVRHFLSDSNNSVRIRVSQALFEICKNVPNRRRWGRRCKLTADSACRRGVYGITARPVDILAVCDGRQPEIAAAPALPARLGHGRDPRSGQLAVRQRGRAGGIPVAQNRRALAAVQFLRSTAGAGGDLRSRRTAAGAD